MKSLVQFWQVLICDFMLDILYAFDILVTVNGRKSSEIPRRKAGFRFLWQ